MNEESSTGGDLEAETCWAFTVFNKNPNATKIPVKSDCPEVLLVETITDNFNRGLQNSHKITADMYKCIADFGFAFSRGYRDGSPDYTLFELAVVASGVFSSQTDIILASYKALAEADLRTIPYLSRVGHRHNRDIRSYLACVEILVECGQCKSTWGLLFDELTPSEARHILTCISEYGTDIPEDAMHVLYKKSENIVMADITSRIDDTI